MHFKLAVAVVVGLLAGAFIFRGGVPHLAQAQDTPRGQRVEYRVFYSPVESVAVQESVQVEGKVKVISHGPRESAEAMTKEFNTLAADGWEYVGTVAAVGLQDRRIEGGGALVLFKREKK